MAPLCSVLVAALSLVTWEPKHCLLTVYFGLLRVACLKEMVSLPSSTQPQALSNTGSIQNQTTESEHFQHLVKCTLILLGFLHQRDHILHLLLTQPLVRWMYWRVLVAMIYMYSYKVTLQMLAFQSAQGSLILHWLIKSTFTTCLCLLSYTQVILLYSTVARNTSPRDQHLQLVFFSLFYFFAFVKVQHGRESQRAGLTITIQQLHFIAVQYVQNIIQRHHLLLVHQVTWHLGTKRASNSLYFVIHFSDRVAQHTVQVFIKYYRASIK